MRYTYFSPQAYSTLPCRWKVWYFSWDQRGIFRRKPCTNTGTVHKSSSLFGDGREDESVMELAQVWDGITFAVSLQEGVRRAEE